MSTTEVTGRAVARFVVFSALGLFLFLAPIPTGDGTFNIPLGIAIGWFESTVLRHGEVDVAVLLLLAVTTVSALGAVVLALARPTFREGSVLAHAFRTGPVYVVSRVFAAVFAWMIFTGVGPEVIVSPDTGGVMQGVAAHLIAVFVFLGFAIPILTDFGVMEFAGALVARTVRRLFTLPGRSSVDLMASWFGSSVASVILTRGQHEKGYYTGREAAVICTNFAFVSLPFSFVVAGFIGIEDDFLPWYLIICVVCVLLALVTPRIWPLRGLPDTFVDGSPADASRTQAEEAVPDGVPAARWGLRLATERASRTRLRDVAVTGLRTWVDIYADLIPLILAWGTIAVAIFEFTPVFQWLSTPMGWYLGLFGIGDAMTYAPATLIGFADMFLPSLLLGDAERTTQLVLGALSIVQIVYMTETGVTILKSRMPLNLGKLFAVFLIRTLVAIPVLAGLVWLVF
ncbi:YjiH family protein [Xylanimonas protaetiae]|uniref:YjiH family protein n=1 Tax=Xylanimonas protaetiae TaxID=2509457 RepID=UPI001F5D15AB|nr:nucleoside recognition domain-containing protein [Xylanimonas protaetiae]